MVCGCKSFFFKKWQIEDIVLKKKTSSSGILAVRLGQHCMCFCLVKNVSCCLYGRIIFLC